MSPEPAGHDPDTERFNQAAGDGHYLLKRCRTCQTNNEPSLIACKHCGSTADLEYIDAEGRGVLVSLTRVNRSFDPDLDVPLPLFLAVARLQEGPLAVGRLPHDDDAPRPSIGDEIEVRFEQREDAIAVPYFHVLGHAARSDRTAG
ncbi:Zn-ribbon domain-containing OB-fold protein [Actinomycetospora sp. C-140]